MDASTVGDDLRCLIAADTDVVQARQTGRELAAEVGFSAGDQTVIAAASSRSSPPRGRARAARCASGSGPMPSRVRSAQTLVHWAVATLALEGERESGDLHLVQPVTDGVLIAVVDGLGHGEEAAAAARL